MRINAVTRGANTALNCGDVIYNAFSFIDADSSGNLSRVRVTDVAQSIVGLTFRQRGLRNRLSNALTVCILNLLVLAEGAD